MSSKERREDILKLLNEREKPVKGSSLANQYSVTRQVIVKDIAILRASGANIIATPDGYTIIKQDSYIRDIIVTKHDENRIEEEMEIVIKYGGAIEDVIVTHPVYGEIKAMIMVRNLNDLNKFMERCKNEHSVPLSILTEGSHMHTIAAIDKETLKLIKRELKEKGFLI